VLYVAPKLMGAGARSLVAMPDFQTMDQVPNFTMSDVRRVGDDLRLTLTRRDAP
jgi:diaminohydroxyphosphoribosylaminopyrimidine deaminase/5-amino-6-(5-phosphoribosylamino)uracil reductase